MLYQLENRNLSQLLEQREFNIKKKKKTTYEVVNLVPEKVKRELWKSANIFYKGSDSSSLGSAGRRDCLRLCCWGKEAGAPD